MFLYANGCAGSGSKRSEIVNVALEEGYDWAHDELLVMALWMGLGRSERGREIMGNIVRHGLANKWMCVGCSKTVCG